MVKIELTMIEKTNLENFINEIRLELKSDSYSVGTTQDEHLEKVKEYIENDLADLIQNPYSDITLDIYDIVLKTR